MRPNNIIFGIVVVAAVIMAICLTATFCQVSIYDESITLQLLIFILGLIITAGLSRALKWLVSVIRRQQREEIKELIANSDWEELIKDSWGFREAIQEEIKKQIRTRRNCTKKKTR